MYYIINPLIWPFTIIPNLPQNLLEVIDSPIPLSKGNNTSRNNPKQNRTNSYVTELLKDSFVL